jgi:enolase
MTASGTDIAEVTARRVWDSRGWPTVEAEVRLSGGARGRAIAPAGASRGSREAVDLRDGGAALGGRDVRHAVAHVDGEIAAALRGRDARDQAGIDAALVALDGTANRGRLGGNALVAVSLATLHAAAAAAHSPLWAHVAETSGTTPLLPLPEIQIFGGGAHAGGRVDLQDFMVMVPGAASFAEAIDITAEVYHAAGAIMSARGRLAGVADEGGWWPDFRTNEEALETLCEAILRTGEHPGGRVVLSLDVAASEFGKDGRYRLALENRALDASEVTDLIGGFIRDYAVVSVEDPLAEDDLAGLAAFTAAHGHDVQVVGDDALVTNANLVTAVAAVGACNAVLLKVNQAGTVSETAAARAAAARLGWGAIVSARSGETEDVSIVHLATGWGTGQLKVGSMARTERTAKWNEAIRIEAEARLPFAGGAPLAGTWWARGRTPAR